MKFAVHQVLLLHFDSIDGKTPRLGIKVQKWKKRHRNEWVDLCEIEKKMIQNAIASMPMSDDRKKRAYENEGGSQERFKNVS